MRGRMMWSKPMPWRAVKSWGCVRCGECCRLTVQLTVREWLDLTRRYGNLIIEQMLGGFYLRKTVDNQCPFLAKTRYGWLCNLQRRDAKPLACRMWPFKLLDNPKYGRANDAYFDYRNQHYFIYVVPNCPGVTLGLPSEGFIQKTLPEIVDIRMGLQRTQHFSTARLSG
jgi:Fe-S-cluster containining protein